MTHNRRHQRRFAFQVIYSLVFGRDMSKDALIKSFDNFWTEEKFDIERQDSYAWTLVEGVFDNHDSIDKIITLHSQHWKLNRIAKVELTILRLCLFEMLYCPDIPLKVAMNEAIELAKDFGDDNSKTFVNGVLDAAAKGAERDIRKTIQSANTES
ncbi:MAG: transcription antitermination factor NusB [Desulfomicrobium sp.]|nr:transcription antitermination factor NusB [Desulfomicrobium sp.]MDP3430743.1 transcription antitermination factor NusB [Desulfomicrobium sp.]